MKKILLLFSVMVLCLSFFAGCEDNKAGKEELNNIGEYDDCVLELKDAVKTKDEDGVKIVRVKATFTNNNQEPLSAASVFSVRAFQNDKELKDISDIVEKDANAMVDIKNGKKINVSFAFKLDSDKEVEVFITSSGLDDDTLGKKVYFSKKK